MSGRPLRGGVTLTATPRLFWLWFRCVPIRGGILAAGDARRERGATLASIPLGGKHAAVLGVLTIAVSSRQATSTITGHNVFQFVRRFSGRLVRALFDGTQEDQWGHDARTEDGGSDEDTSLSGEVVAPSKQEASGAQRFLEEYASDVDVLRAAADR